MRGRKRSRCSSVPSRISMSATMKWVFTIPDTLIQPRESSQTASAYVVRSRPSPPYSSGIVKPKMPSSFRPSTMSSGNASACSSSEATGMIRSSANWRTRSTISRCSSVS